MPNNLIVISIDGLSPRYLGPYGNTWLDTPAINALAAKGILFENIIAEQLQPQQALRSTFDSWETSKQPDSQQALGFQEREFRSILISQSPNAESAQDWSNIFDEIQHVNLNQWTRAENWSETNLANLFAVLIQQLGELHTCPESADHPFFVWCDSQALLNCWDAPEILAQQFYAADDPAPYASVSPPTGSIDVDDVDPDLLLSYVHAYAAQVTLIDHCLAALLAFLDEHSLCETTQIALTSSCGYPLGEHGVVGCLPNCVYSEAIHIPLIISQLDSKYQARRYQNIGQLRQLAQVLLSPLLLDNSLSTGTATSLEAKLNEFLVSSTLRPFARVNTSRKTAIQTPAWLLVVGEDHRELFVKPDDRWEVNDVADICHEVTLGLTQLLNREDQANTITDDIPTFLRKPID
ncbi:MAG TPA: sulfatase-like hydrolase/transferase [Pirellulaceae bacterium]|nr:sulfatase-like hydrolase/transferase [Pirellulaceae bacterium]